MAKLTKHILSDRDAIKRATGAYEKFVVERTDGSHLPGGKHCGCQYFVLDVTHDPLAKVALKAYARACAKAYPQLSKDLAMAAVTGHLDYSPTPPALAKSSPKN